MNQMPKKSSQLPNIVVCIIMDIIGYASFAVPGLGEFSDIIWAPLSAFIFYRLFGGRMGVLGGSFSFLEEILPFTDFIPTFTISWFLRSWAIDKTPSQKTILFK
ncbi:hypothetical protein BH11BAC4_BH11BAC4_13120 [soil metagenome]